MPRSKGKILYIENDTQRKATYKKRQKVAFKKAQEISTLCECEVAGVRYSEYHTKPMVYPNYEDAVETFRKFEALPLADQSKNMMTTEEFIKKIIKKKEDQLYKLQKENDIKEKTNMMHEVVNGKKIISIDMKTNDLNDLMYVMKQNLKFFRKLKIKADEEGSASQPISSSGTNSEGPTSPTLLVPQVDPLITIPSSPMLQELMYSSTPQQMDSSMNISTMPMNNYSSSESIEWDDDSIMSFFDDSYLNNINVQHPK
ncbi:agamous-like MADS-box protein AGL80 [Solanum stenotomum]|uniref:agamous-like MADS-box protein AGL80 n=1 Tax=Solanum stenotomum TaxID=172797 RepID=UPI0020D0218D|nr:agamous-like MADS-box protein AGL80 [Solanum stenotomum]